MVQPPPLCRQPAGTQNLKRSEQPEWIKRSVREAKKKRKGKSKKTKQKTLTKTSPKSSKSPRKWGGYIVKRDSKGELISEKVKQITSHSSYHGRKIHIGPRGGKYYLKSGSKIYIH